MPETTNVKVADLLPGDLIDLEGDAYADPKADPDPEPHPFWSYEYAKVGTVERETRETYPEQWANDDADECIVVHPENGPSCGFPVGHEVPMVKAGYVREALTAARAIDPEADNMGEGAEDCIVVKVEHAPAIIRELETLGLFDYDEPNDPDSGAAHLTRLLVTDPTTNPS